MFGATHLGGPHSFRSAKRNTVLGRHTLRLEASPVTPRNKKVTSPLESAPTATKRGRGAGAPGPSTRSRWVSAIFLLLILFVPILSGKTQEPNLCPLSLNAAAAAQSLAPDSRQPDTSLVEAKSLVAKGLLPDAERAVRHHLLAHADSAEGHFLLGYILFREIQTEAQLETTVGGVKNLDARSADSKTRDEKARQSLAEFTAGAKYHEPNAFDLKIVALDYVLLGDYVDADKWLSRSVLWSPQDIDAWYYLGRARYNENKFADAVSAFQQCLKLSPRNVKAEDNLGLALAGLGRNEEATAAYKQAMDWQSQSTLKNPGPYIDLGSLLLDESLPEEAVPYLVQAIEISPSEPRAHELLGKAYTRMEQLRKAQTELEKATELAPENANLHCMLAPVYRKLGIADKAKTEFERCAALSGSHSTRESPRP
jgi:tetratricopeptide (TPR) repeat protein